MKQHRKYLAFGLVVDSAIALDGLPESVDAAQITIRFGHVPEVLEGEYNQGASFCAQPGRLLLKVLHIARYMIQNGNEIIIEPLASNADPRDISVFLMGSAFGALLHQRQLLPIHGSAIRINDKAIVIAGISGAGKSTLAATFRTKGFAVLADDIACIGIDNQVPLLYPGLPALKLWDDALQKLLLKKPGLEPVREGLKKYRLPAQPNNVTPVQVGKIFVLQPGNSDFKSIEPIAGLAKFNLLKNHTFRSLFVGGMQLEGSHFQLLTHVAQHVPVYKIKRNLLKFEAARIADTILDTI